jgi:hypothetical protein
MLNFGSSKISNRSSQDPAVTSKTIKFEIFLGQCLVWTFLKIFG